MTLRLSHQLEEVEIATNKPSDDFLTSKFSKRQNLKQLFMNEFQLIS